MADASTTVTVSDPPVASISASASETDPETTVDFDASASSDPDGTIQTYDWSVDGVHQTQTTNPSYSDSWLNTGSYTVEVLVTDDAGMTDTASTTVDVTNAGPTASVSTRRQAVIGYDVVLDASGTEPDGGAVSTYDWTIDGEHITQTTTEVLTYSFNCLGSHTVEVVATDEYGVTGTDTMTHESIRYQPLQAGNGTQFGGQS